jgi:hypothetical protein
LEDAAGTEEEEEVCSCLANEGASEGRTAGANGEVRRLRRMLRAMIGRISLRSVTVMSAPSSAKVIANNPCKIKSIKRKGLD